ncbi:MAG TPA: hypothetical protein VJV23_16920 [Candidatus Polarisedimenticolia bacterium]|nr:hypothetical protein [Candidatus Polarisedimenticolia bacterium]
MFRAAVAAVVFPGALALGTSPALANCTQSVMPVFQCGFAGWFDPPPAAAGAVAAVWWQIGYGNNTINIWGQASGDTEGTGIAPAGVFSGNDSGLAGIVMTGAREVLPQYAAMIPEGALCSNFENAWASPGVDGCSDNPRQAGSSDDDNLLNPYWGAAYGPGADPPYYTLAYQIDYPMAFLLHEGSHRFFALAFVASKARIEPKGADAIENFFDLGEVSNGEPNPVLGRDNVIPWQPVPRPRVDSFESQGEDVLLALSWDNIRLVHDGSLRPSPRVVAGGVGVLDQLAQPGGLCRYQLQTAPASVSNPNPTALAWSNAGPPLECADFGPQVLTSLTVPSGTALRIRTLLGKRPRTAGASLADARLGALGDLGFEATACSSDDCAGSPPVLVVGEVPLNTPPEVAAGSDLAVTLPAAASLQGSVTDDGLPVGSSVSAVWSKVSGPGDVVFADPAAPATTATFSAGGAYVLSLTATDGDLTAEDQLTVVATPANQAPAVDAGPDLAIELPAGAVLDGDVTDDGLPAGGALTARWTMVSGPGVVVFANPHAVDTTAGFSLAGDYVLRLEASDGELSSHDDMAVAVSPQRINEAPIVDAGPDAAAAFGEQILLDGTVTDDGLPLPPRLSIVWTKFSGPGDVHFVTPLSADTLASFTAGGSYVLRLSATDGQLSGSDFATVVVAPPENEPPVVDAGPDQTILLSSLGVLDGTVTDDGLPAPSPAIAWSVDSGPAEVVFFDAGAADTTVQFGAPGEYLLRLTADDGLAIVSDTVVFTVEAPPEGLAFEARVATGPDDAEQKATGSVTVNSTDLEMVLDADVQTVGMRFANLPIPKDALVVRAWLQLTVDEPGADNARLELRAQAADSALAFTTSRNSISSRPLTAAAVLWTPPAWPSPGVAGPGQRSPDLSPLLQEVIARPGWNPGGAIVLVVTGSGKRTAEAFEGDRTKAPLLHVEIAAEVSNQAPEVDAGLDQTIRLPAAALLDATVTDDGLPHPPGATAVSWSRGAGPGVVTFDDPGAVDTGAVFSQPGTYVLRLEAHDGELSALDEVTVVVEGSLSGLTTLDAAVTAGTDDAEERATGSMKVDSGDLELVFDGSNQTIGIRFASLAIPPGAVIRAAWIQFRAGETQSEPTSLAIQAEAADSAPAFTALKFDISARSRTTASTAWAPPPWGLLNEESQPQRTPDLSAVVQEVVGRPGWAEGSSIVFLITGTGHRTAESFEGGAAKAPRLHVEYTP